MEMCRSAEAAAIFTDQTDDRASTAILNFDCVCKPKETTTCWSQLGLAVDVFNG